MRAAYSPTSCRSSAYENSLSRSFFPRRAETSLFLNRKASGSNSPVELKTCKKQLTGYFPGEAAAIGRYFEKVLSVCSRTPSLNIYENEIAHPNLDEDFISLDAVLNDLTANAVLRGLLSGYAMCYGVKPSEISFANHSRMVLNFYESISRVKDGGDAFIRAFQEKFKAYDVDIRCGSTIAELADIQGSKVGRFVLNTGEEVSADTCVFTIHPKEILNLLPKDHFSKAFAGRITSFESSAGFFSVFATLKPGSRDPNPETSLLSLFPDADVNNLLDPAYKGMPALVIIKSPASTEGNGEQGICILEPSFFEQVSGWSDTRRGKRPQAYLDYKRRALKRSKNISSGLFRSTGRASISLMPGPC